MNDMTTIALTLLFTLLTLFFFGLGGCAIYITFRQRDKDRECEKRKIELHESRVRQANQNRFEQLTKEADKLDDNGADASARG